MKTLISALIVLCLAASASAQPYASSYNSSLDAAKAFDGSLDNPWQAGYPNEGAWTLGYAYPDWRAVSSVRVVWFTLPSYPTNFIGTGASIQGSQDGVTWTTLATVPGGAADVTLSVSGTYRWVQLLTGPSASAMTPAVAELVITSSAGSPPGGSPPPPPAAAVCAPVLASTSTGAACFGDSITYGSSSPFSYCALLQAWRAVPFVNLGVAGNHTAHMLGRIADPLASGMPTVLLFGGTNDVGAGTPTATTISNVDQMVGALVGREIVIVGPLPRNNVSASGIQTLRVALRDYAISKGLRFIDPYPAFEDRAQPGKVAGHLSDDGVHPNGLGAITLARLIAHAMGWRLPGGD